MMVYNTQEFWMNIYIYWQILQDATDEAGSSFNASDLYLGVFLVQISAIMLTILTEMLLGFLQSFLPMLDNTSNQTITTFSISSPVN
jgi:hypothetical protein